MLFNQAWETSTQIKTMTRLEKLRRWARLVRQHPAELAIFSHLEEYEKHELYALWDKGSAFALAARDPEFRDAGLRSDSVGAAMDFFELSQQDIHEFSCNCGGYISNKEMADRISYIALMDGGFCVMPTCEFEARHD